MRSVMAVEGEAFQRNAKNMNRRKKINQLLKAHAKKASAKLAPKSKPQYISKADRLKLAENAAQETSLPEREVQTLDTPGTA